MNDSIYVVILAGGKGARMESPLPKVLIPIAGKTLIDRVLDAVLHSNIITVPIVVVGHKAVQVKKHIGNRARYILQSEQRGTAHAVMVTEEVLKPVAKHVLVLNGDHPLISPKLINDLMYAHIADPDTVVTLATTIVPNFSDWRSVFLCYGRVQRNETGSIVKVVEAKDANENELGLELNLNYFCFNASWLWPALKRVQNNNAQSEYYLTDIIGIASSEGKKITSIQVANEEALGINTKAELDIIETILSDSKYKGIEIN